MRRLIGSRKALGDIVNGIWTEVDANATFGGGSAVSVIGAVDVQPGCGMADDHDRGAEREEVWNDGFEDVIRLSAVSELGFVFGEQAGVLGVLELGRHSGRRGDEGQSFTVQTF